MDNKRLNLLLSFLGDSNNDIDGNIEIDLISMGKDIVPGLERKWEEGSSEKLKDKIVKIIHKIHFNDVKDQLRDWATNGSSDLFFGAFLVAKYHYPNLSYELLNEMMNIVRRDIWFEMNDQQSPLEKIRAFNRIFYGQHRFQRNVTDSFSIQNNLVNSVINSKRGNDISLGILYVVLCQRLGLPVYGVNLPSNFILAYMNVQPKPLAIKIHPNDISKENLDSTSVLFFVNPFIDGVVLSEKDITLFLKEQGMSSTESFFRPTSNAQIINILLNNLESCYDVGNSLVSVDEIHELSLQLG